MHELIGSKFDTTTKQLATDHYCSLTEADPCNSKQQSDWSRPIYLQKQSNLLVNSSAIDKARLLGCSAQGASAWLSALPSSNLGLRLSDEQLRIAVCLRLGSRVSLTHSCVCGSQSDAHGIHALSCNHIKARHSRHHQLNSIISRALTSAMIPNRLEPTGLLRDHRRPDGLTLVPWKCGRNLAWDASCVHRLARSWVEISGTEGTPAADQAERNKAGKYQDLGSEIEFAPAIFETLGGIGALTSKFLQQLAQRIKEATGDSDSHQHLLQRLGIAIQKGNAGCIMEALHSNTK